MSKKKNTVKTPDVKKHTPPGFIPKSGWLYDKAEELRNNRTGAEKNFGRYLDKIGVKYESQLPVYVNKGEYIIDFAFYSSSLKKWFALEIDGGYHSDEEQKKKDNTRDATLLVAGWLPIRMKNRDTNSPMKFARLMLEYQAHDIIKKIAG